MENSMLLSQFGCFLTEICHSILNKIQWKKMPSGVTTNHSHPFPISSYSPVNISESTPAADTPAPHQSFSVKKPVRQLFPFASSPHSALVFLPYAFFVFLLPLRWIVCLALLYLFGLVPAFKSDNMNIGLVKISSFNLFCLSTFLNEVPTHSHVNATLWEPQWVGLDKRKSEQTSDLVHLVWLLFFVFQSDKAMTF